MTDQHGFPEAFAPGAFDHLDLPAVVPLLGPDGRVMGDATVERDGYGLVVEVPGDLAPGTYRLEIRAEP